MELATYLLWLQLATGAYWSLLELTGAYCDSLFITDPQCDRLRFRWGKLRVLHYWSNRLISSKINGSSLFAGGESSINSHL